MIRTADHTSTAVAPPPDQRLTVGLLLDVRRVLEAHGFQRADDRAHAHSLLALGDLTRAHDGRDR